MVESTLEHCGGSCVYGRMKGEFRPQELVNCCQTDEGPFLITSHLRLDGPVKRANKTLLIKEQVGTVFLPEGIANFEGGLKACQGWALVRSGNVRKCLDQ
jgi:hypothetical protein